jgi:FKBP-type peptidyl-prolyl cis-trans isomerase (trigger factor)
LKILKQDKTGNQVVLEIEEEYSKIDPHLNAAYKEASNEVRIPGFRQGKVPAEVMKKYISEEAVVERAAQMLLSKIYPSVIVEAKIKPVDYPNIELGKFEKGKPIVFKIKVDVFPDIKLASYKGLKLKKMDIAVTDDEISKTIDYIKAGWAKQNNIAESEVVLDDGFAKSISTSGTMEELKALLKNNIELDKKNEAESARRDDISKQLAGLVEGDIPNGMVEREIEGMVHDLESTLKRNKMTLASYLSAVKKDQKAMVDEMKPAALARVKAKLALEKIIEKEKLEIDELEMDKEVEHLAEHAGKPAEEYKASLSEDMKTSIKDYLLNEKAMELVISKAKEE